jgi:peroxiredoxin
MTGTRMRRAARAGLAGLVVAGTMLLAGCANDPLADQYLSGDSKNYIAGDGTVTEIEPESRQQAVDFTGTTAEGGSVSQADYSGEVVVLNFWYASCAPCRVEAPELAKLSEKYDGEGASFLGVNVRDQAPQAISFEETYGIDYPSVIDTDGALQLAFSGDVSPNAVPTTLVIDKQGRVAARILGQVSEPSILDTLIRDTIAESS